MAYCALCLFLFLLSLINRLSQRLVVGLDVAPDVAVALVAGGLSGVLHALGLGKLAQEHMPQYVRRQLDFSASGRGALAWAAMRRMIAAASRRNSLRPLRVEKRVGASSARLASQASRICRASRCTGTPSRTPPPLTATRAKPLPVYCSRSRPNTSETHRPEPSSTASRAWLRRPGWFRGRGAHAASAPR